MKGITTIAAIPSGAGQAAHLPAERVKQQQEPCNRCHMHANCSNFNYCPCYRVPFGAHFDWSTPPTPADKQGLEPPEYAERN